MKRHRFPCYVIAAMAVLIGLLPGPSITKASDPPAPRTGYHYAGQVPTRHANQILSSRWSIGAETMDRDYTIYAHWKDYLGPLGVKHARIQSGWAKTEQTQGVYNFAWLDEIVPDMIAQGVQPWMSLSYGNTLYPSGGGTSLNGGLPTGTQALAAWDNYVAATVQKYQHQINTWEVWNEPNSVTSDVNYAAFYLRTAQIIRQYQPDAKIIAGAITNGGVSFVSGMLNAIQAAGKIQLVDEISYHPYTANPDTSYQSGQIVPQLKALAASYSSVDHTITLRQGENGAPSVNQDNFALRNLPWTENSQAKWNLRRMLGDLGNDIAAISLFSIADMNYGPERNNDINYKGLLATNADQTIDRPKLSYAAMQHVTAIFDDRLSRITNLTFTKSVSTGTAVYGYKNAVGQGVLTLWFSTQNVAGVNETNTMTMVDFTFNGITFLDPVWVDMVNGNIFSLDASSWGNSNNGSWFNRVPIYNGPVLLAERALVIPEPTALGTLGLISTVTLLRRTR